MTAQGAGGSARLDQVPSAPNDRRRLRTSQAQPPRAPVTRGVTATRWITPPESAGLACLVGVIRVLGVLVAGDLLGQDHDAIGIAVVGELQPADGPFRLYRLGEGQAVVVGQGSATGRSERIPARNWAMAATCCFSSCRVICSPPWRAWR